MQDASSVLISPFKEIWQTLAAQARAWTTIQKMLAQSIGLPLKLSEIDEKIRENTGVDSLGELSKFINESYELALEATHLLSSQQQAIVYPGLVGAWAIIEASFDDLILKILINDPGIESKLMTAGIKTASSHSGGTEAWAKEIYMRVESKAKAKAKGLVVELHKASFSVFGIALEYPADQSRLIEELNQARNCILHNQGVVDDRTANICPRFAPFLGSPIPPSDPIFSAAHTMLLDYTTSWIAALMHSPYLRDGLLADAKNPFST